MRDGKSSPRALIPFRARRATGTDWKTSVSRSSRASPPRRPPLSEQQAPIRITSDRGFVVLWPRLPTCDSGNQSLEQSIHPHTLDQRIQPTGRNIVIHHVWIYVMSVMDIGMQDNPHRL